MGTRLRHYLPPAEADTPLEMLSLSRPELVQHVHREYLDAGADILTTNTFGASALRLRCLGREADLDAVNRQAVENARAVALNSKRRIFIAASVGPLGSLRYTSDIIRLDQMEAEFDRQMKILAETGIDLFFIETMDEYREAVAATRAAARYGIPVVTHLVSEDGAALGANVDLYSAIQKLEEMGVAAIGLNCRIGPEAMFEVAQKVARYVSCPLSLQPNAGNLHVDNYGRMEIAGTPEAFNEFGRKCAALPIGILGGCCHTGPEHIRALRAGLEAGLAQKADRAPARVSDREPPAVASDRPPSSMAEKLASGRFFTCVEIDPPTDAEVQADPGILAYKVDGARYLEERSGIDVFTVADHTMGRPWLDGFPFAETLRPHLKSAEILLHYSCRNKAETDITGNFAAFKLYGYRNILIITGDRPASSECFYQYSSHRLIERVRREHGDFFFIACSFDHNRGQAREGNTGIDAEIKRMMRKVAAGARVALTQPVYSPERVFQLRERTHDLGVPILPGIMPIMSVRHAETVNQFPGIAVPETVIERLRQAGEDRRERAKITTDICSEVAQAIKEAGFPGIYLITTFNRFDVAHEVLSAVRPA